MTFFTDALCECWQCNFRTDLRQRVCLTRKQLNKSGRVNLIGFPHYQWLRAPGGTGVIFRSGAVTAPAEAAHS